MLQFSHTLNMHVKPAANRSSAKPFLSANDYALNMRDIAAIRRDNLLLLIPRVGETGRQAAIALDMSPSYLSQLKAGKAMGDEVARKIEQAAGLEYGWMDNPQDEAPSLEAPSQTGGHAPSRISERVAQLELCVALLVAAMTDHRPAEAADVAAAIREHVPEDARTGVLAELLQTLELSARPARKAPGSA